MTTPLENDYFIGVALQPHNKAFIFWVLAEAVLASTEEQLLPDDAVYWWTDKLLSSRAESASYFYKWKAVGGACWVIHRKVSLYCLSRD